MSVLHFKAPPPKIIFLMFYLMMFVEAVDKTILFKRLVWPVIKLTCQADLKTFNSAH